MVVYPSQLCIHELFEAQVREAPDRVAVVHGAEELSYGDLNERANRLAHHLIGLGVKPDQPVAICLERSPMMVVGVLAILKAGGAYLPLDPAYPSARLNQVLNDAAPRLMLCDAAGRQALGAEALGQVGVVDLDTAAPAWAGQPATDPDPRALGLTARHLAYIIYTSGSTGTPKGVMVEHRSTANLLHWNSGAFARSETSRVLFSTSISFDLSVYECFGALSQGGTLSCRECTGIGADAFRRLADQYSALCHSRSAREESSPRLGKRHQFGGRAAERRCDRTNLRQHARPKDLQSVRSLGDNDVFNLGLHGQGRGCR
ncbi:Linear gramicidin synthase subunit D [Ensifer sesbaniae]|nr:Linear gramicidin synthase subunit D [Ensifer sesbaniae]